MQRNGVVASWPTQELPWEKQLLATDQKSSGRFCWRNHQPAAGAMALLTVLSSCVCTTSYKALRLLPCFIDNDRCFSCHSDFFLLFWDPECVYAVLRIVKIYGELLKGNHGTQGVMATVVCY